MKPFTVEFRSTYLFLAIGIIKFEIWKHVYVSNYNIISMDLPYFLSFDYDFSYKYSALSAFSRLSNSPNPNLNSSLEKASIKDT
jgi:hypothetical protein